LAGKIIFIGHIFTCFWLFLGREENKKSNSNWLESNEIADQSA
jgi:hypothetical protein